MKRLLTLATFLFFSLYSFAQVTTASMSGKVTGGGDGLIAASVFATHVPTGTNYGVITLNNGSYNIPNMRVGGPYQIEFAYLGFATDTVDNVFLQLGQKLTLDATLREEGVSIDQVVITGAIDPLLNNEKTGAGTSINRDQLKNLPTISRSADDYTRLNPMSAEGGSFAGRNDQFNNYSVNGTIFNNPFGLDAATPGGQSDAQPISLDAIDQITVNIAPYDVTQSGFTGASVNAVTKSGTNTFKGTVYGFFRNSDMTGGTVDGLDVPKGDLSSNQYGVALGGPIVKNKVFFFANFENTKRSDLGSLFEPNSGTGSNAESRVLESDMKFVSDLLKEVHGYDTGDFSNFRYNRDNTKGLLKLDFNLSKNHSLSATYNFLDAYKEQPAHPSAIARRGPDRQTLQFENSGYRINNKIHSGIVELRSIFGNKYANKFQAGLTSFRDNRDPFSEPFPVFNIAKNGLTYIVAGHEPFSVNNVLSQDVVQIKNDFNIYLDKHSLTIGSAFERFNFDNSFNLTTYGFRVFNPGVDINDVEEVIRSQEFADEVAAARSAFDANNANDSWALAETNLGQWSLYVQDEMEVSDKLNLTIGIRADLPLYFNTSELIQESIDRAVAHVPGVEWFDEDGNTVVYDHTELPKGNLLINPRIGFNYDMNGDKTAILRGGSGLFAGRFPFVWIGNQVANPEIFFYNVTDPDFKFPQVWRTNLGFDKKIGEWTSTVDILYTKDLNAHMVQNHGLNLPTGTLGGVDGRPIYQDSDKVGNNAYVFTNTNSGSSFNASLQVQRSWGSNFLMLAYNYLDAKEVNSIDAEISSDAYDRNPANISHTNKADLAPSLYGNKHRFIGAMTKKFSYGNGMATTVSLFAEYAQGGRFSYTYSGDINNDGSFFNDLLYIPTDSEIDEMDFSGNNAAEQRTAFKELINQDDYLSSRRGEHAERYATLSPWYSKWDLRILQDIAINSANKFQISIDVLNIGNLISSSWGVRQSATNSGLYQPLSVNTVGNNEAPEYTFNDITRTSTFVNNPGLISRWQAQVGLRYMFN